MGIVRPAHLLCFGSFQLDLRAGELCRNGVKVPIPHQSVQALAILLEHSGEVVTREELHQKLWPNGTIVEFDNGINAVIKRLRQALEDSADDPKFIETLPRRGYRFLLPVEQAEPEAAALPAEQELASAADFEFALVALTRPKDLPVQPPRLSIRKRLAWAAATLALTAGGAGTMAYWRRSVEIHPLPQIAYSGQDADASATPDRKTLAFTFAHDSRSRLIVNSDFSAVPIACGKGYAYQAVGGEDCNGPIAARQDFNNTRGFGWTMIPNDLRVIEGGNGLTGPNTLFNPPSFQGFWFKQAAFLQGSYGALSQTIGGFSTGKRYILSFYLGSRYRGDSFDGNQTIQALIDEDVIGTWALASFTPFTLQRAAFSVSTSGDHTLKFVGMTLGDHTAFLSEVRIKTATANLTVSPSEESPGALLTLTGSGFTPNETILFQYSSGGANFPLGSGIADPSGAFTTTIPSAQAPRGGGLIRATGRSTGVMGTASFSTTPRLIMNPSATMVGKTAIAQGFGFGAGENVEIYWSTPQLFLGTARANREGSFHQATGLKFTIPARAPAGANLVTGKGQVTQAVGEGQVNVH